MQQFEFTYTAISSTVTMDDYAIHIKQGPFVKKNIDFTNLIHFYEFENHGYRSLYWVYTNEKGKRTKFISMSNAGEEGFMALVQELGQKFPEKNLSHLSEKEAFAAMNVSNPKKLAPWIAFGLIFFIMVGIFYPGLRHYLDFGFSQVQVDQIINNSYDGSRNVAISGILLDKSLEETTTTTSHGSTTTTVSEFIPMVDQNWQDGMPVKVFLSFDKLSDEEYTALFSQDSHTGVIRNIAWEGMSKDQVKFFKEHYGMTVDEHPVLIEITGKKHNDEWVLVALGATTAVLALVFFLVALKMRKKKKA